MASSGTVGGDGGGDCRGDSRGGDGGGGGDARRCGVCVSTCSGPTGSFPVVGEYSRRRGVTPPSASCPLSPCPFLGVSWCSLADVSANVLLLVTLSVSTGRLDM